MHVYDFGSYCSMISDKPRTDAYVEALTAAIRPDSVVLDIGSGTGFFSILACRLGARKVYAVEPNDLSYLARQFATENGCADRIEFIDKLSTEIELDEKADVIVCDLRGATPLYESSVASMIDARKRLAKADCQFIPMVDEIFFVPCQADAFYEQNVGRHMKEAHGVTVQSARRLLTNGIMNASIKELEYLCQPQKFATLDYRTVEETSFASTLSFTVERSGVAHGLRGWFEADMGNGIRLTNSPENLGIVYGAPFLPFHEPVEVEAGDLIEVSLKADHVNNDYTWTWGTRFATGTKLKAEFQQSTMMGLFRSPKSMLKGSEYFVPRPSQDARIDAFVLERMNGDNLAGDIADELQKTFETRFRTFEEALSRVAQLSERYSD